MELTVATVVTLATVILATGTLRLCNSSDLLSSSDDTIDDSIFMTIYHGKGGTGYPIKSTDGSNVYSGAPVSTADTITIFIHGWNSSAANSKPTSVRNALLGHTTSKVIMLDWSKIATSRPYTPLVKVTFPQICKNMTIMLANLVLAREVDTSKLTCVGHSYGAHLCGCLGRYFNSVSTPVKAVIGLDPGDQFGGNPNEIKPTDAPTTITLYTSPSQDGGSDTDDVACWNWYINHGNNQPMCLVGYSNVTGHNFLATAISPLAPRTKSDRDCNHDSAMLYYSRLVTDGGNKNYICQLCSSAADAKAPISGKCGPGQKLDILNMQGCNGIKNYNVKAPSY